MPALLSRLLAFFSLLSCLLIALIYMWGQITLPVYKNLLAAASLAWFVFATIVVAGRRSQG